MNIKIIKDYYDLPDKRIYEADCERKVPDERGHFLIERGFAIKCKAKNITEETAQ